MRRNTLAVLAATVTLLSLPIAHAQNGPGTTPPAGMTGPGAGRPPARPPEPPTLAQALALATPPKNDIYLSVGADAVHLPRPEGPDAPTPEVPPPGSSVSGVVDAYGRLVYTFGGVTALAPPTMTLLNTDPGTPNPFADMPKEDACRLLFGSLTNAQWAALTSSRGLGAADLTDETQRGLFAVLFPPRSATVHVTNGWGSGPSQDNPITLTEADMGQVRLRLSQRVMIGLPMVGKNSWLNSPDEGPPGQAQYQMYGGMENRGKDTLYGVKVRDTVPNALKNGDLDYELPALAPMVSLDGVQTVGDLIARVGQTLRLELYADRRYETRRVTLLGPKSARARDVLKALALCVAGTYRRVGPAFVLTDDVVGAGTRRMILHRFAQTADMMRHSTVTEAGDRLLTVRGGVDALPGEAVTDLGFSDAEKRQALKDNPFPMLGQGMSLQIPLAQLTPAQQRAARQYTDSWNQNRTASPSPGGIDEDRLTLDGKILLQMQATIQMVTPVVPGPVNLSGYLNAWNLFQPSQKIQQAFWEKQNQQRQAAATAPKAPAVTPPPPPALAAVLPPVPRRAVIARPQTAKEVDALVASMKIVGLNQLWLDVFSGGRSHLDPAPGAKEAAAGSDILTEALAQTKGTDITVIPTLDLLDWDGAAPAEAVDRTMLGETSAEAGAHRRHYEEVMYSGMSEEEASKQPVVTARSVSPASDTVRQTLLALIGRLAATPGVTALTLQGTVTPGYDHVPDSHYGVQGDPLGYTVPLRLAFLRRRHVDPIDLEPESYDGQMNADTSLPGFEDYGGLGDAGAQWNALRLDTDRDLMVRLLAAARTAGNPGLTLWVKTRRSSYQADWYGLWEDPRSPLPELSEEKAYGGSDPDTDYAALARAQCRTNVLVLDRWRAQSAANLAEAVQAMKPGWNGFVLDLTAAPGDPLADLVKSLRPPPPPPPTSKPPVASGPHQP